jgi:hypothetical protein
MGTPFTLTSEKGRRGTRKREAAGIERMRKQFIFYDNIDAGFIIIGVIFTEGRKR